MPWTRNRVVSPSLRASSSKTRMNSSPTILRFVSGIGDAREPGEEPLLGADVDERHVEVAAEGLDDLLRLVRAHQPVIDEHARQLVADRLVDEQRRHGRVDAAREPADDALRADLGPDPLDLLLDHGGGRPRRRSPGDLVEEVLQDLLPVRRVHDLRVELDGVEPAARVLERRDRRRRRRGGDAGAGRRLGDGVAVAHPDDLIRAGGRGRAPTRRAPPRPCRTRRCRSTRRSRRGRAPSPASRNRSRASGSRARARPCSSAARPRRRPRPGRRRGSARAGSARAPRPP